MNGQRLSESMLDPAFTSLRRRVLYRAFDVTRLVDTGASGNTFAAMLGHGWPDVFAPWGGNDGTGEAPWNGTGSSALGSRSELRALSLGRMTQAEMEALIARGFGHGHTGYERRLRAWLSIRWSDGTSTTVVSSAAGMGAGAGAGAAAPKKKSHAKGPAELQLIRQSLAALLDFFNRALPITLLYRQERLWGNSWVAWQQEREKEGQARGGRHPRHPPTQTRALRRPGCRPTLRPTPRPPPPRSKKCWTCLRRAWLT
jgi:hypothetical protein